MKWPFVRRLKLDAVLTVNQAYLDKINYLNQELASELNSHRETKKKLEQTSDLWHKSLVHNDSFLKEIRKLEKELEETKDALKIAQEKNWEISVNLSKSRAATFSFIEIIKDAIDNFTE